MYDASCSQHSALAQEISALKAQRDRWVWTVAGVLVALSWVSSHFNELGKIVKLL
jgi:hypothetical protein